MIIKCPVCDGRGVVVQGFYSPYPMSLSTTTEPDICRLCNGNMVIDDENYRQQKAARVESPDLLKGNKK